MINTLIKGIFGSFGIKLLSVALAFLIGVLLTRTLGVEQYGNYGFVISVISVFAIPIFSGWSNAIIKIINEKSNSIKNILFYTLTFNFIAAALAVVAINITEIKPLLSSIFIFILAFLFSLPSNLGSILRALGFRVKGQVPDMILKPFCFICIFLISYKFIADTESTSETAIIVQIVSLVVVVLFLFYVIKRLNGTAFEITSESSIFKIAFPFMLVGFANSINSNLPSILIGNFVGFNDVAFFKVSQQLSSLINVPLSAILVYFSPHINITKTNRDVIKTKLQVGTFFSVVPSLFLCALIIFFSVDLLTIFFGAEFSSASNLLIILSLNELTLSVFLLLQLFLNMSGYQGYCLKILVLVIIFNAVACSIAIPHYGALGACLASLASNIIWMAFVAMKTFKVLRQ